MSGAPLVVDGITVNFTVGRSKSADDAASAIRGLRLMVLRGAEAAGALAALERDGFHDVPSPYISGSGQIVTHPFPKRLDVSEADLPDLSAWELRATAVSDGAFCGHLVKYVEFTLSMPTVTQIRSGKAAYSRDGRTSVVLLKVRVGKKAVTVQCGREAAAPGGPMGGLLDNVAQAAGAMAVRLGKKGKQVKAEHAKTTDMRKMARSLFRERFAAAVVEQAVRDTPAALVMMS